MTRRQPETVRELIAACYANLASADSALSGGRGKYITVDYMIAARLYKGLVTETMSMRSLYHDERLKMTMPQACYYCGSQQNLAVDHLIPRLRGGPDEADNLIWACRACNSSKSGRDMLEWMQVKGSFPSILLLRRYVKIVSRHCSRAGCMDVLLEDSGDIDLPFDIKRIPAVFPPLGELRLWVYPES